MSRNYWELLMVRNEQGTYLCVGLDPNRGKIPESYATRFSFRDDGDLLCNFTIAIARATAEYAAAFKPNFWFWFTHGVEGLIGLRDAIAHLHDHHPTVPVILDFKGGDIGDTNIMAAIGAFDQFGADAITVHPYLGSEAMSPFLERADKGIYVLCRTSNPGAGEFQDLGFGDRYCGPEGQKKLGCKLFEVVAETVRERWNAKSNCGLVTGATYPAEIEELRKIVPNMPLLVPGIGKQGGDLEAAVKAAMGEDGNGPFLINVSSAICHASSGDDFAEAARAKSKFYHDEINRIREAATAKI